MSAFTVDVLPFFEEGLEESGFSWSAERENPSRSIAGADLPTADNKSREETAMLSQTQRGLELIKYDILSSMKENWKRDTLE